ncbi:MAG: hypothetical protein E6121_08850 [Varibaculum cambriense]|nr:hypothetical protein [Varibaculum cambriense]
MPATTKNLKIPYPTGGDPVRDGPQTFAEAMQLIENYLFPEWKPVTLAPNWVAVDGYPPEYCKLGDLIVLRGMVARRAGGYINNIFSVPEEARPASSRFLAANTTGNGRPVSIYIQDNGTAKADGYTGAGDGLFNLPISGSYYIN